MYLIGVSNEVTVLFPAGDAEVPARKSSPTAVKLAELGITRESLLLNIADIAQHGASRTTKRDKDNNIVSVTITESAETRLKATEKLLNLLDPKPVSRQTMYAEKIEW